jgi:hypothetical protein
MRWHSSGPTSSIVRAGVGLLAFAAASSIAVVAALGAEVPRSTPGVAGNVASAIQAVTAGQQTAGYWMTAHTRRPLFEQPRPEVNTFTPAVIVSLLEPVVRQIPVGSDVERARTYLRGQIEDSGLVRYHGRPDQPYLPQFGCAITPDSDSTALAWTFAPFSDRRLPTSALSVLEQYRTADGLYRTWLGSRSEYQCIDPGRDPNPPDVGINMHVYLFLVRYAPGRAGELCAALRRAIDQDRIWVYYEATPLVPLLREVDLARAGCDVHIPERRLHTAPAGQEPYLKLALAHRALALQQDSLPLDDVRELLAALADDDFAYVRSTPPLLYNNDMTATNPRFYWSPEVGYALWLRTYAELADPSRHGDEHPTPVSRRD